MVCDLSGEVRPGGSCEYSNCPVSRSGSTEPFSVKSLGIPSRGEHLQEAVPAVPTRNHEKAMDS